MDNVRSAVQSCRLHIPMVTEKSEEGCQTEVGLDRINDGMQPHVLQRGRAVMACRSSKSQGLRAAA